MAETSPVPFTHDMVVVHRLFRREFGQAPDLVRGVADGDVAQAARVQQGIASAAETLHHHHTGEDIIIWPRLRERAEQHSALLDDMESQHAGIDPLLARLRPLADAWVADPRPETAEPYARVLQELHGPLMAHLDQEERDLLPIIADHITVEEWALLPQHSLGNTPPSEIMYVIGGILEDATPDERAALLGNMPPAVRTGWEAQGRSDYIGRVTAMRGVAPATL